MKANRLFWLGRYTERVYTSLHILRRCYDKMIDGRPEECEDYYRTMDINNKYEDIDSFKLGLMYDTENPASLISGLERANDNAIVLREEIMSETLSYIQMAVMKLKSEAAAKDMNITNLQSVTDNLLSFWGSLDERIDDERVRNILVAGRLLEYIDMHVRFQYCWRKVGEVYCRLKQCGDNERGLLDRMIEKKLDEMFTSYSYNVCDANYRYTLLKYLNQLVLL